MGAAIVLRSAFFCVELKLRELCRGCVAAKQKYSFGLIVPRLLAAALLRRACAAPRLTKGQVGSMGPQSRFGTGQNFIGTVPWVVGELMAAQTEGLLAVAVGLHGGHWLLSKIAQRANHPDPSRLGFELWGPQGRRQGQVQVAGFCRLWYVLQKIAPNN